MAAPMIQVKTTIVPPFPTCFLPPPAWSPAKLYGLLSAHGRSRVDMNRELMLYVQIRDKWISALRSGRYCQLYGYWHRRDKVCAVEVILHELGYEDSQPRVPLIAKIGFDLCSAVITLNDRQNWSFRRIADWLEAHTKPSNQAERYVALPQPVDGRLITSIDEAA
jgi:hypothetical protein